MLVLTIGLVLGITGCDRPVEWCEGHHLKWWWLTKKTNPNEGMLLCEAHHHLFHEEGWELMKSETGWVAISPDGERFEKTMAPPQVPWGGVARRARDGGAAA